MYEVWISLIYKINVKIVNQFSKYFLQCTFICRSVRVAVGTMKMDIVVKCFQFGVSIGDTTEKQKVAQCAAVLLAAVVVVGFPSARHMWVRRSPQRRKKRGVRAKRLQGGVLG